MKKTPYISVEIAIAEGSEDHGVWGTEVVAVPASVYFDNCQEALDEQSPDDGEPHEADPDAVILIVAKAKWEELHAPDTRGNVQHIWLYHYNPDELTDEEGNPVNAEGEPI
jgi:hypothetical protein